MVGRLGVLAIFWNFWPTSTGCYYYYCCCSDEVERVGNFRWQSTYIIVFITVRLLFRRTWPPDSTADDFVCRFS
uniref:Putative secreted peptide n=1 Tax=Anopheles braziliensis TaxID=58242 RepID=A0A2M3ZMM0_9DIPT